MRCGTQDLGVGTKTLQEGMRPDERTQMINDAVAKVMESFPPR